MDERKKSEKKTFYVIVKVL